MFIVRYKCSHEIIMIYNLIEKLADFRINSSQLNVKNSHKQKLKFKVLSDIETSTSRCHI